MRLKDEERITGEARQGARIKNEELKDRENGELNMDAQDLQDEEETLAEIAKGRKGALRRAN